VNTIRYSVPVAWIGRRVEVRETRDKLEIELDARHLVTHERALTPQQQRITRSPPIGRRAGQASSAAIRTRRKKAITDAAPETALYVAALKQKAANGGGPCPAATIALAAGISARTVSPARGARKPPSMDSTISTAWSE